MREAREDERSKRRWEKQEKMREWCAVRPSKRGVPSGWVPTCSMGRTAAPISTRLSMAKVMLRGAGGSSACMSVNPSYKHKVTLLRPTYLWEYRMTTSKLEREGLEKSLNTHFHKPEGKLAPKVICKFQPPCFCRKYCSEGRSRVCSTRQDGSGKWVFLVEMPTLPARPARCLDPDFDTQCVVSAPKDHYWTPSGPRLLTNKTTDFENSQTDFWLSIIRGVFVLKILKPFTEKRSTRANDNANLSRVNNGDNTVHSHRCLGNLRRKNNFPAENSVKNTRLKRNKKREPRFNNVSEAALGRPVVWCPHVSVGEEQWYCDVSYQDGSQASLSFLRFLAGQNWNVL